MAKNPSAWANNDIKPVAGWTPATKQKSLFANNITKSKTAFNPVNKQISSWAVFQNTSAAYLYDSPTMRYDDTPIRGYDFLVPTTNTINNKRPAAWAVVV